MLSADDLCGLIHFRQMILWATPWWFQANYIICATQTHYNNHKLCLLMEPSLWTELCVAPKQLSIQTICNIHGFSTLCSVGCSSLNAKFMAKFWFFFHFVQNQEYTFRSSKKLATWYISGWITKNMRSLSRAPNMRLSKNKHNHSFSSTNSPDIGCVLWIWFVCYVYNENETTTKKNSVSKDFLGEWC